MLLRVGIAMVLFAVASAAVVVVAVNLWGIGDPAAPPEETPSEELFAEREVAELPVVPEDWPRPSGEEVSEARGPATTPRTAARTSPSRLRQSASTTCRS